MHENFTASGINMERPLITREGMMKTAARLSPEGIAYWESRRISEATLREWNVGEHQDEQGKWFTFPILDVHGLPWFYKYRAVPPQGSVQPKSKTTRGGTPTLWPLPALTKKNEKGTIYVAEGEPDTLTLLSNGYIAVTSTHGCRSWSESFCLLFPEGVTVTLALDNDASGKEAQNRIEADFAKTRPDIKIKFFAFPKDFAGKDVNDYFCSLPR